MPGRLISAQIEPFAPQATFRGAATESGRSAHTVSFACGALDSTGLLDRLIAKNLVLTRILKWFYLRK